MDVLYVYCYKSVGSYKHKLSRTVFNRTFSVSLLGNKLYNYPNLSNCDTSREELVDSGTSTAALR